LHITGDISIGSILTSAFTVASLLIAIGRQGGLLEALKDNFDKHCEEDNSRFSQMTSLIVNKQES